MNNQEAKQEAIKKAYGDKYELLKSKMDSNGYVEFMDWSEKQEKETHPNNFGFNPTSGVDWSATKWRPASLRGLLDNNGWIRIEHDGSNLPERSLTRFNLYDENNRDIHTETYNHAEVTQYFNKKYISHYRPIEKLIKPIY